MGLYDLAKNAPDAPVQTEGQAWVGLSRGIVRMVSKGGLGQAQITLSSPEKGFDTYRGPLSVQVADQEEVTLWKGDTHSIWFSHQENQNREGFTLLFDTLYAALGQRRKVRVPARITME